MITAKKPKDGNERPFLSSFTSDYEQETREPNRSANLNDGEFPLSLVPFSLLHSVGRYVSE